MNAQLISEQIQINGKHDTLFRTLDTGNTLYKTKTYKCAQYRSQQYATEIQSAEVNKTQI